MQDYIYSVIAFVAMAIHLIINTGTIGSVKTTKGADAFDFVLTDAWMPVMTGMDLVAAIRANPALKGLKVYLFTAEVEMRETYAEKGFDGLLLKPATLESLSTLLSRG